ncbi:acyltransferase domain-containing protein, partial [Streptomyces sp. G35A]
MASGVVSASAASPVFVFPGQGAQWAGMAVELLESSSVFAARFSAAAASPVFVFPGQGAQWAGMAVEL